MKFMTALEVMGIARRRRLARVGWRTMAQLEPVRLGHSGGLCFDGRAFDSIIPSL
jgi:hypothetical protein